MKRLVFHVGMMLVTFALGIGIYRLFFPRWVDFAPPKVEAISLAPVELRKEIVAPVSPVVPVPAATPKPILILDYDQKKFRPWAAFYVMGSKPREFRDFETLEVALSGYRDHADGYIEVYTHPADTDGDRASANFALVTERRLFFTTTQMPFSEVEYRFDGQFLRTDFNAVDGKNIAVLRGTLTKTKNGRKIAEHTFTFRMQHLGC